MNELRRSDAQNRKLRAMLEDISRAKPEGREHAPDTWKAIFMAALDHDRRFADAQMIEGLEGRPPLFLGYHSSLMTVSEMADLITLIQEYGDRHGVRWGGGDHDIAADPLMRAHGRTERPAALIRCMGGSFCQHEPRTCTATSPPPPVPGGARELRAEVSIGPRSPAVRCDPVALGRVVRAIATAGERAPVLSSRVRRDPLVREATKNGGG